MKHPCKSRLKHLAKVIRAEAFVNERWISCNLYSVIKLFAYDEGSVAENLQKDCLCYLIFSTSLWRKHFNHIKIYIL